MYVDWVFEVTEALYNPEIRYIFLKWWSGAGKSYLIAQLMIQLIIWGTRIGFFRKVSATLKMSCQQLLKDVKSDWNLNDDIITIKENKQVLSDAWMWAMFGLDDEEKIKSLANFDMIRMEEATEFTFDDFTQLDLRLRWWKNHKIICTFNPVTSKSRLKTEIEDHPEKRKDSVRISKTAWDNRFVWAKYLESLEKLKEKNEQKYKIYALNLRGESSEWNVYKNYSLFTESIDVPDVIWLDFWYNDPNVMVYLKVKDVWEKKDLYAEEIICSTWQTSQDLIAEMIRKKVPKNVLIIADWARPEMIMDIRKAGYTITSVKKYKASKTDQINHILTFNLHLKWPNITNEVATYSWKKLRWTNEYIDTPEDWDDHCMDALAYWGTHYKRDEVLALF